MGGVLLSPLLPKASTRTQRSLYWKRRGRCVPAASVVQKRLSFGGYPSLRRYPPHFNFFLQFWLFWSNFFFKSSELVQIWYFWKENFSPRVSGGGTHPKIDFFRKFISMITQKVQLPLSQSFLRTAPRGKSKAFRRAPELKTSFRFSKKKKKIAKLSFSRKKCSAIYFSKNRKKIPSSKAPLNASPPPQGIILKRKPAQ